MSLFPAKIVKVSWEVEPSCTVLPQEPDDRLQLAADPTWGTAAVFANHLLHDAANTVTIVWDSSSGMRRSTDRMATFPTITSPLPLNDLGFVFRGHGMKFDGFYWFPGNDVQGYAAFAKVAIGSETNGANWTIESTALDNSQFDFVATNDTIALALVAATGVVWRRTIGGTWQQVSAGAIAQGSAAWKDLLWCSGRGRFAAMHNAPLADGAKPLWLSADGEQWESAGDNIATLGRLGYSPTLDQLFVSAAAASATPILSELKTFNNSTHFRLFQDANKGISVNTYSKAT